MNPIPAQLLNAFVVFNESSSISEAADRLGITQPALTKQLQRLQDLLSEPVFTSSGRKKVLTRFGRSLDERLKSRMSDLQEIIRQVQITHSDPRSTLIRIGGRREILDRISTELKFVGSIEFVECTNQEALDLLMRMKLDIGVTHKVPDTSELIAKPLFREEFQIVVPKRLIAQRPTLSAASIRVLTSLPCVAYRHEDEIIRAVFEFYKCEPKSVSVSRATDNYASLASMVDRCFGWSVLPSYLSISEKTNWILPLPSKAVPQRAFMATYRSELASAPWLKTIIHDLKQCFGARP